MADHIPNVLAPFEAPYATHEERKAHADGLRALADWLENSRFPIPAHSLVPSYFNVALEVHSISIIDEGFVKRAGSAARLIGGKVEKGTMDYSTDFKLERDFGGGVRFRYLIQRNAVCEAVEVTKPVEIEVPVDTERAAEIEQQMEALKAEQEGLEKTTVSSTVTELEYQCPESLLAKPIEAEPEAVEA